MRIGYLSSYPPIECGIATYTSYLEQATSNLGLETFVVAPHGAVGDRVVPTYDAGSGDFAPAVYQMFMQRTPDLVHIQHDYDLYGPNRGMEVVDLVLRLRLADIPVVITLHRVYETLSAAERLVLSHLLAECSGIVVHEEFQRETLRRELGDDIGAKITVLDHGVREVTPIHNAKRKLGLHHQDKIVMMCGYFRPTKGFHKAIDFFGEVAEAHPDAVLVMAGKTQTIDYHEYRADLIEQMQQAPFANRVQILTGQFPQHTFDTLLSASDVVVLPYDEGAQSGVLAQALAFKKPVVTSQLRAFTSVTRRSGGGVSCADSELGLQINRILGSKAVANGLAAAADTYVRRRAGWSVIARRVSSLYTDVLTGQDRPGRYVHVAGETTAAHVATSATGGPPKPHQLDVSDWLKIAKNFDPQPVAAQRDVLVD